MGSVRCVLEASKFRMLRERVRSLDAMVIWYNIFSGTLFTIPSENIYCILSVDVFPNMGAIWEQLLPFRIFLGFF